MAMGMATGMGNVIGVNSEETRDKGQGTRNKGEG